MAQSLESLRHNLGTYLTRTLRTPKDLAHIPHSQWIEGTALFADLTGFTTLTERLRELGDEGAERLNTQLNQLFAAMLEPLTYARGEQYSREQWLDLVFTYSNHLVLPADRATELRAGLAAVIGDGGVQVGGDTLLILAQPT